MISGKIDWVKDLETLGDFPNKISDVISRTLPMQVIFLRIYKQMLIISIHLQIIL